MSLVKLIFYLILSKIILKIIKLKNYLKISRKSKKNYLNLSRKRKKLIEFRRVISEKPLKQQD